MEMKMTEKEKVQSEEKRVEYENEARKLKEIQKRLKGRVGQGVERGK